MIKIGLIDFAPADKIIDIKDKKQVIKARYVIDENAKYKYFIMEDHYIEISFELDVYASFKRSDYIEYEGLKFIMRDNYKPKQGNKNKYSYTLKFESEEMLLKDADMYYLSQNLKESSWKLTSDAKSFIKIIVDNANRYFKVDDFKVGIVEPIGMKSIFFDRLKVLASLTEIAKAFDAEWYISDRNINLVNKLSFGTEIEFETEVSVESMKWSESSPEMPFNRIIAYGSTRNIPANYRGINQNEGVDAIYQQRLRIPVGKGETIDAFSNMSPEEVVEGSVVFDEVYPKRVGTISEVTTKEYTETNEDTGAKTKWNAYRFKDSGLQFKEEYILPGVDLRIVFQSGNLNGLDFGVKFNPDKHPETDPRSQIFEIVRNEDYGAPLPNGMLFPVVGEKYILYGFDIQLVANQFVSEAENELYNVAVEWLDKNHRDTRVCECPTMINYFADKVMDLDIGQKVNLIFDDDNPTNRASRIMGFEKKLINKYDAIYTVGDNAKYSNLDSIREEIKELKYAEQIYVESSSGSGIYVIKQFDSTRPTNHNVYSAKASDAMYLNKQTGGTVEADTTFAKNMQVQGAAISDVLQNSTFTAGQFGSGFQIKRDANGQSYIEVDNLMVRRETVFNRLTIAELKSVGGTILLSLANMVISKVEDKTSTWRCYFDNANGAIPNDFAINDQVICRKYTGKNIKYYWSKVTSVGVDFIEISKTDKDGSGVPAKADEVIQFGNRNDVNRQYAIMLSAYGSDAPSIKQYAGVNSYDLTGKEVTVISPQGNKFKGSFTISTNGTSTPIYKDMGTFQNGKTYYLNDRVSYLGSYWVCIVNTTVTNPNEGSSTWRKDTTGQTDINNAVAGVIIGGRNLLNDSSFEKGQGNSAPVNQGVVTRTTGSYVGNYCMKTVIGNVISESGYSYHSLPVTKDKVYTISFYLKAESSGVLDVRIVNAKWTSTPYRKTINVTTSWERFDLIFTATETNTNRFIVLGKNITFYVDCIQLEEGNKVTSWELSPEDVQTNIDNAYNEAIKVRTEYKSEVKVLDDKIASKVSQSVFDDLGNRVSQTESRIDQQAGRITSVVKKVNDIKIGGKNLVDNSQAIQEIGGNGADDHEDIRYTNLTVDLVEGEEYTFQCKTDGIWGYKNDTVEAFLMKDKIVSPGNYVSMGTNPCTFTAPKTGRYWIRIDSNKGSVKHSFWEFQIEKGNKASDWGLSQNDINKSIKNVENRFDNMSIGSDNLITNSAFIDSVSPWLADGNHSISFDNDEKHFSTNSMKIVATSGGDTGGSAHRFYAQPAMSGEITISFYAKAASPIKMNMRIGVYNNGVSSNITTFDIGTSWELYTTKTIWTSSNAIVCWLESAGIMWMAKPMVVNGNKVPAWSQSSKDIELIAKAAQSTANSLSSRIDQTADQIQLAVSEIKIGGKNLVDNSQAIQEVGGNDADNHEDVRYTNLTVDLVEGEEYTFQCKTDGIWGYKNDTVEAFLMKDKIVSPGNYVSMGTNPCTFTAPKTGRYWIRIDSNKGSVKHSFWEFQIEKGNKASDWGLSQNDINKAIINEVASLLTIEENKISLASKTIELNGTTIAKAIAAKDLEVGNREELSALEVKKDGTFYAKGSKSDKESLIIDSQEQSIRITSLNPASGDDKKIKGTSEVIISSESGGITVTGSTDRRQNSNTIISTRGISVNTAGQYVIAYRLRETGMAAIVGEASGYILDPTLSFYAGVYGTAISFGYKNDNFDQNKFPVFGGYFERLRANGLYFAVRRISMTTSLDREDCYVTCYNNSRITVYLPKSPYKGHVIYLRQMESGGFTIHGNGIDIHTDGGTSSYANNRAGRGDTTMMVYDGNYWCLNYMPR